MRRSLLNKLNTPKALRQALVLFTLLLLPTTAWGQAGTYGISIAGTALTSENYNPTTGAVNNMEGVTFDFQNSILTLENVTIESDSPAIESSLESLTIKISGNNNLSSSSSNAIQSDKANATLRISRDGSSSTLMLVPSSSSYAITGFNTSLDGVNAYSTDTYSSISSTNGNLGDNGKAVLICSGTPYGFYVGGTIVTSENKGTVLGSGVDYIPGNESTATLKFSDNATIPGDIEWDLTNDLTIEVYAGNTIQGRIYTFRNTPKLYFTYPSGSTDSNITIGNSEGDNSAIEGFSGIIFPEDNKLKFDENLNYIEQTLMENNQEAKLVHISYQYGLTIYNGNNVLMNFSSRKSSFSSNDNIAGFSSGSISFDNSSKTLTLTGVTISDGIILWDHTGDSEKLKIALSGNSTITCATPMAVTQEGGPQVTSQIFAPIISGAEVAYWKTYPTPSGRENEPYLQFTSADQNERSLILSKTGTDDCIQGFKYIDNSVVDGTVSHTKTSDNGNNNASMLISSEFYGVQVNGIPVHGTSGYPLGYKENVTGEKNSENEPLVTYNPTDKKLTLNGATLTNSIISNSGQPLTIDLSGGNTISCDASAIKEVSGTSTAPDLIFESTDGTGYFRITPGGNTPAISGYNVSVASEGLFVDGDYSKNGESVTVAKGYDLQVKGTWVSNANASNVLNDENSPTVTFDAESNTLTLNGATINDSQIAATDRIINYKGTENLTIAIKGNTNTAAKIAYSGNGTPNLIFSKAEDGCLLTLVRSDDNYSVIEGFADVQFTNAYFKSSNPYIYDTTNKVLINPTLSSNDIYYNLNQIIVTPTVCYKLWINATQVTGENAGDILGDSNATFTAPSTLYLKGISIDNPILNGLDDLGINISGENSLNASSGTSGYILSINPNAALTLSKGADNSSLSLGNTIGKPAISGFKSVTLEDGLYLKSDYLCRYVNMAYKDSKDTEIQTLTITTEQHYPLWVVDRQVTPANRGHILGDDDETVTFDGTNTLTLNGASISSSSAIESNLDNLVINLKGENSVGTYSTYGYSAICSGKETATLTIAKDPSETGNVTLNLSSEAPVVKGFASVSHEGLYFTSKTGTALDATNTFDAIISSAKIEPLWIEDYLMTDETTINGTSGTITYNSTDKVLTLNGFQKEYGTGEGQIQTGVEGLTIKIVGENNINATGISTLFKAFQDNATIKFVGTTADDKLMMTFGSVTSSAFEGFADGAITYENLVYSGEGSEYTIQAPTAPAMTVDSDGKVKMTKGYDDGTIHYSIAYADDTPGETDVEYSEAFALTHPATVTAWVEANNATTSTVTGKHFAYQDAPYTMAINGTKTPVLLPAIAESDPITLSGYTSSDGDIATFANGLITAKSPGTATLSVTLSAGDTPFTVLNPVPDSNAPHEHAISFDVYVGEPLGNYFEGSNEYGSFYNETAETYAVPQGMKAYVVTGVSGSNLFTEETTVLPPNTVVLLEKAEGISFTKVPAEGAAPGGNLLKRATSEVPVTSESSLYVLYNDTYVKATAGSPIPTGKNYLDLSPTTNAGTRGFYNIGDGEDTTAIREVKSGEVKGEKRNGEWFDLQGRRLPAQPVKPGLYIHKDKKVVIK